ncbi:MAG: hypothetical protein HYV07_00430 [Deltaproteobacteria bacterium]|nr:hypothetical protein [Deltaproteobacteria bacterium]
MKRILIASSLSLAVGCASAGRQAAWEKEATSVAAPAGAVADAASKLASGEEAWAKRDDKKAVEAAIAAWEEVAKADPANADVRVKLARAYYYLADAFISLEEGDDLKERLMPVYEKGADWGEEALIALDPGFAAKMKSGMDFAEAVKDIQPGSISAAYWYCTNLGRFAVQKGLSARLYYKDRVKAAMERIKGLDESFFYAGADRYFGAFYSALPSIAGKDLDKSKIHFEKAVSLAPSYLPTKVVQADFLARELDDRAMYEKILNEVLAAPDGEDANCAPENRAAKRQAQNRLAKVAEIF